MEKNHPVAGAAGCNVETSFVGCLCERADPFVVGRNERQKHNVALVALKTVGIAADQASPFHFFRAKSFEQLILDQRSLCFSLKNNYSNRHFIVSAVITQFSYPCDDGLGFRLVPWASTLEQQLGRQVSGVVRAGGGIDWTLGRKRGLGI